MDEKKLVHAPHVGPDPVIAEPNHVREKTYQEPAEPKRDREEIEALPENEAKDKVRTEMPTATDRIIAKI